MKKAEIKLKKVAEEIKSILRKNDVAASFVLHTPGHSEYVNHFLTSYSCAYQYEETSIKFYCKREEFKSIEQQTEKLSSTSNMLRLFTETVGRNFMMIEPLSKKFDSLVGAEHS
jgi:hypothetical protein